ncbi:acetyltransferase [Allomuricauda sp. d1]|uniref:acetyltransferase n=1 Tax=Allomuricauda sp. d1 TaxID=3136725 RepID=UPI0031D02877
MKNIVIFGASGHGSVVLDCIKKEGKYNVVGFVDYYKKKGRYHSGHKILGNEYDLPYLIDKHNLYGGIVAIGDNWTRKKVVDKVLQIVPGFNFISAVHPSATIGLNVNIGDGTVVMPGAIINANCEIGNFCILNTNCSLDHDGKIENYSSMAPRACAGGNLSLGSFSAICLGANVIEKITIAEHSVIGAGSLVIDDIDSHVVAYGTPAKTIRRRNVGDPYLGRNENGSVIPFIARDF